MNRLAPLAIPATEAARSAYDVVFCDQIAFTLMMYKAGVSFDVLPRRHNFPNFPVIEAHQRKEFEYVAIIHYLRHEVLSRTKDFPSRRAIEALVQRTDLSAANEVLRARVAKLVGFYDWPVED